MPLAFGQLIMNYRLTGIDCEAGRIPSRFNRDDFMTDRAEDSLVTTVFTKSGPLAVKAVFAQM
jgi:hypothetical protein